MLGIEYGPSDRDVPPVAEEMYWGEEEENVDIYGREWPGAWRREEFCPTCGQPDNCGDCTHAPYTDADVALLRGEE